jgi:hypothetical protein
MNSTPPLQHTRPVSSRRDFLLRAGGGFGALALAHMLQQEVRADTPTTATTVNPLLPKPQHHSAKAKSVIFLFMDGGPSHLDTFDPKPEVNRLAGQPLPESFERPITPMGVSDNALLASKRKWRQYGRSGIPVSDWLPHIAECIDDIAVIRSCWANGLNHVGSVCQMNTGSILAGRPSLGAWVTYGLGTENQSLPSFVVLLDTDKEPPGGARTWGTGFMPASYQGTRFRNGPEPILNLNAPATVGSRQQRNKLDFLARLNRRHIERRTASGISGTGVSPVSGELEARIAAYELAFRMQAAAPEAINLAEETEDTHRLYGLDDDATAPVGRNCLLARRLVERGVRFVQLYCGSGSRWDAHSKIESNHTLNCRATDKPIAGLLRDLKRRGLLEQTLVVWGGEFGRTPMSEKGDGRDHNPYGFTMWMAGGGVMGGQIIGATDEMGLFAIEDRAHVHDLHATILHLMGIDHLALTYLHNGRSERATINGGRVIEKVLA